MRKKNYKGRCEKRKLSKCEGVCKTYDVLQYTFADILEADSDIMEIRCNVQLEGMDYTSDFLCVKANGEYMVRECVYRKMLTKPMTIVGQASMVSKVIGKLSIMFTSFLAVEVLVDYRFVIQYSSANMLFGSYTF